MNKEKWIARAAELGFDGLSITENSNEQRDLSWYESQLDGFSSSKLDTITIRALANEVIVSTYLEKADDEMVDEVLGRLMEASRTVAQSEKDILVAPVEEEPFVIEEKWTRPSVEEIKDLLARVEKAIQEADSRIVQVNGVEYGDSKGSSVLMNSLGLDVCEKASSQVLAARVTVSEDGEIRDAFKVAPIYNLRDFDADEFARQLVDKAVGKLHARSIRSMNSPVIFNNEAMTTLFDCFTGMFSGSLIAKGISPLKDKLHEKIFSDKITVIDNPRLKEAFTQRGHDSEGTVTRSKIVVDKGIFETILHNTRSALKMNTVSTGNGFASGGGSTDVSAMNMYIKCGDYSLEQLEQKMGNGIVITDLAGMHAGVDFVTTNFSLQASGYLVEDGKKKRALSLITVAGNFLELMKNVVAVGNDLDWNTDTIACPAIEFSQIAIGGQDEQE